MRRRVLALAWPALVALAIVTLPPAAMAAQAPSAEAVLKTLRPGHPRLIALDSDLQRIKQLIASDQTARRYYEQLKQEATESLDAKPVAYVVVGPRLLAQSRRCLTRVATWALLYRLDGDKRFAARAKQEMFAAAGFPNWNPSHFLDTAEMSHAFAIGYDWLYDYLTTDERQRIREALIEKGLKPSLKIYQSGGWWARSVHNWNQVCNGGMTIGALAIADEEPALAGSIVASALRSVPLAMASYAPDGGWAEGPGYWSYATRYNVYMLAALESALGSDFGLSAMEGFDKAGTFRIYATGPIGLSFNFADAGARAGNVPEMFWLARKFNRPLYAWHERQCARRPDAWDLIWFDPRGKGAVAENVPLNAYFRGVDVAFFRSAWESEDAIFVGFKGGDNKANHSHTDLGSFVLDALGHRWAVDLGGDDYNLPGYFGAKRWTYFRLRTESHNTLVINGENQDPRALAPIVAFSPKPDRTFAVADLSAAYKPHASRVQRGIALLERKHVLVQDEIEAKEPVEIVWAMLTEADVAVKSDAATLRAGDGRLAMRIIGPEGARFETMSASPPRPQAQNRGTTKIVVRLPSKASKARIAVVMTPYAAKGKQPQWTGEIEPLERWIEAAR
ncbi:heparinase II/III family protein [Candidatus Sumerlaeota bacterium]|nr:heparinase II/III family protein [Candidatus Sumerlaeota bacterium]